MAESLGSLLIDPDQAGPRRPNTTNDERKVWTLRIRRTGASSRMVFIDPDGRPALRRRIASRDCAALARAFAAIVQAHLRIFPIASPEEGRNPDGNPNNINDGGGAPNRKSTQSADSSIADTSTASDLSNTAPSAEHTTFTAPPPTTYAAPPWWRIGISGGLWLAAVPEPEANTLTTGYIMFDIAWADLLARAAAVHLLGRPLYGRASFTWEPSTSQNVDIDDELDGSDPDNDDDDDDDDDNSDASITSWRIHARLLVAWLITSQPTSQPKLNKPHRAWYLAPQVGLGLGLARVTARDLPGLSATQDRTTRWRPSAEVGITAGHHLYDRVHLRLDTLASLYMRRDRYRIEPLGTVASSPRFAIYLGLGVEFRIN